MTPAVLVQIKKMNASRVLQWQEKLKPANTAASHCSWPPGEWQARQTCTNIWQFHVLSPVYVCLATSLFHLFRWWGAAKSDKVFNEVQISNQK